MMLKTTPLISQHEMAGAKLVDFAGWKMPLHYGSQIQEHNQVREDVGMFDVSHMAVIEVTGEQATDYLGYLLANNVAKLTEPGKALYTCMLNEKGGIKDDLIVYKLDNCYRLVVNAVTYEKDWAWLNRQRLNFDVTLSHRDDLAIIAVQGPNAIAKVASLEGMSGECLRHLKTFNGLMMGQVFYSRTGYTGEDGFEIQLPVSQVNNYWIKLLQADIRPCGLGARDTLRLEAGLNLYGTDMDETTTPLESNLAWTIALNPSERNFIGRSALEKQLSHGHKQLIGLILESGNGILRSRQKVWVADKDIGEITSGTFSPTLGHAIALARVPTNFYAKTCQVEIRQKRVLAKVVMPPFVRKGKKIYKNGG